MALLQLACHTWKSLIYDSDTGSRERASPAWAETAISQWESADDMRAFWDSKKRHEAMAVLQPLYVNQYTITDCAVRIASSY